MIFRGYDIRGVYPKEINKKVASDVGKAFGTFLDGETVVVGRDARETSKKITKPFIDGLRSTGCEVIFIGTVPNPTAYYYAFSHKIFGAYITASHNPPEYTGIKFFKPNGVSFTSELSKIKEIYSSKKFSQGCGYLDKADGFSEYKEFLLKHFSSLDGIVAVESFGGVGELAVEILEEAGLSVRSLRKKIDPHFFGMRPEPTEKNLKNLREKLKKENFGVAYDGDADRSVFVSEKGKVLNGSETAAIFLNEILKKKKAKVILTFDCAAELGKLVKRKGSSVIWWKVGHGFIEDKLVREGAIFAAEQSSHFYFNEFYPFSDGILSTLYMAKILNGEKLSKMMKFKMGIIDKFYIPAGDDRTKLIVIAMVRKEIPNAVPMIDGIKAILGRNEWVLIRMSQTMPEINIGIEARNKKRLLQIKKKYTKLVKRLIKEARCR